MIPISHCRLGKYYAPSLSCYTYHNLGLQEVFYIISIRVLENLDYYSLNIFISFDWFN